MGDDGTDGTADGGLGFPDADGGETATGAGVGGATGGDLDVEVDPDASGRAAFVQALRVSHNATWGVAVGAAVALLVFVVFVLVPGTDRSPLWYVGLAFVLAVSTAGVVATLLTLRRAVRLSREL